jgi:hypothetical protein
VVNRHLKSIFQRDNRVVSRQLGGVLPSRFAQQLKYDYRIMPFVRKQSAVNPGQLHSAYVNEIWDQRTLLVLVLHRLV